MKTKKTAFCVLLAVIILLIAAAALYTAPPAEGAAVDQLIGSLSYADNEISFQIPPALSQPDKLNLHISGRAEYADGFSTSLHFLEEESGNLKPGTVYSIPYDPAYTELELSVSYTGGKGADERCVDLLALVE